MLITVAECCAQVYPARKGYSALFRAGEGDSGEGEEWHPTSVTPLPVQVGSLTATSSCAQWQRDNLFLKLHIIA